jgi:hypothetical protein
MSNDDVDRGEMPDELDAFFDDLRSAAANTPAPLPGDALATLFRDGTAPVVAPLRRRWAARAVVAGAVGSLAFGGLGVAGALPRPVQQRVADVVDRVGVHLPDARPETTTTVTVPATTTPSTTPAPRPQRPVATPTTVDDHGSGTDDRGSDDHESGADTSGRGNSGNGNSGNGSNGNGDGSKGRDEGGAKADSGSQHSARNPGVGAGVHLQEGSDHSGHDDEGRTE